MTAFPMDVLLSEGKQKQVVFYNRLLEQFKINRPITYLHPGDSQTPVHLNHTIVCGRPAKGRDATMN